MSTFLDTLKVRLVEAQRRHQEVAGRLQRVQVEFQSATQQLQSWQIAVQTETLKEQAEAAAQAASQPQQPQQQPPVLITPVQNTVVVTTVDNSTSADVNKTQIIREQLRQHPAGMTGKELWDAVKAQIAHRPYVYSVLKRLRDKEEVIVRRKKYRLVPKPGEDVEAHTVQ